MADDIAAIHYEDGKATVYPTFPAQKLCRNEVEKRKLNLEDLIYINEDKDKFLVPVTDMFVSEPRTLKSLFFIIPGEIEEVTIKKLSGLEQLAMIHHNLFLKRLPGDWENDKEYMNLCLKIAGACETYAVGRPKNGDSLQVMADKVRELA
jgi:hypothetical protein